jgi:hypothetical protein
VELLLNLAGVLVAAAMVCLWLRWAPRAGVDRRTQVVALALLILILFPVISVTDDLMAARNPAETDTCVRRNYADCVLQQAQPLTAGLPEARAAELPFVFLRYATPGTLPVLTKSTPALAPIENRPPPAA